MRVLVAIPHFFRQSANAAYGSERGDGQKRAEVLRRCLTALNQTFGHEQAHINNMRVRCNGTVSSSIKIILCTTGNNHLVDRIPTDLFVHKEFNCDPRFLGYECHTVLADGLGKYDYYCFMEDDIEITDPLFFTKMKWFSTNVGTDAVLQPHRYELSANQPVRKLYIDGRLRDPSWSSKFQDVGDRSQLQGQVLGTPIKFERSDNPHSGCFFLNEDQMRHWMKQDYFLDRSDAFAGPLESAATLGLMRAFRAYKPAAENAGFLEVQHLDRRYLEVQLRFISGFSLA